MYAFVIVKEKDKSMPRDPVCGAVLDERTSKFKITHEGDTYYFCSVSCKRKFKRNRRKFARKTDMHI
jgi:Cu+-exporting ATPase